MSFQQRYLIAALDLLGFQLKKPYFRVVNLSPLLQDALLRLSTASSPGAAVMVLARYSLVALLAKSISVSHPVSQSVSQLCTIVYILNSCTFFAQSPPSTTHHYLKYISSYSLAFKSAARSPGRTIARSPGTLQRAISVQLHLIILSPAPLPSFSCKQIHNSTLLQQFNLLQNSHTRLQLNVFT